MVAIINADYGVGIRASVSGVVVKVYLLSSSMRAILASSSANLIPIQIRGPKPKLMAYYDKVEASWLLFRCKPVANINLQLIADLIRIRTSKR